MNYSIYIPPPFPFPNQWNTIFSSSEPSPWLCPSTPLVYSSIQSNTSDNKETIDKQINQQEKPDSRKETSETVPPGKYRVFIILFLILIQIEISEEWMDFVERSYKRIEGIYSI